MGKIEKLLELIIERKNLWNKHGWSCEFFSQEEKELDDKLYKEIQNIQDKGIYLKCYKCETEDDTVDYNSESPNNLMCEKCWDKLREYIKDKCGLL